MIDKLYTIQDVAEKLACSPKTVRRLLDKGLRTGGRLGIPKFYRLDTGRIRIPERSIKEYMEKQQCQG